MAASNIQDHFYRLFFEAGPEGMLVVSEERVLLNANPEACSILGYTREELLGEKLRDIIDTSDHRWKPILEGQHLGNKRNLTLRLLRRNGTPFIAEVTLTGYPDGEGGNLLGVVFRERSGAGETRDEGVIESLTLAKNDCESIILCDADNTILYVSPSVEHILGYGPKELMGVSACGFVHPDDLTVVTRETDRTTSGSQESSLPIRYRRKDGSWVCLKSITKNLLDDPSVRGIVIDSRYVTDRTLAEHEIRHLNEEGLKGRIAQQDARPETVMSEVDDYQRMLHESTERFRAVFEQAAVGIALVGTEGQWLMVNDRLCDIVGYRREELLDKHVQDVVHPDDLEEYLARIRQLLSGGIGTHSMEKRYLRKDNGEVWVNLTVSLVREAAGRTEYFIFVVEDVTERKRAEKALHESERRYRTVVEQAAENVFLVDVETTRILEANAALHASLGYTAEELTQLTLYDVVAHDRESIDRNIQRVLREKRCFIGERNYRRKDGSLVDFEVSVGAIPYGGRETLCIVAHNVTERKQTEENLRRSLGVLLALREAGQILGSTLETEEIVTRLLKIMRGVSGLTAAVISVQDEHGQHRIWRAVGLEGLWRRARYAPEAEAARHKILESGTHQLFRLQRAGSETEYLVGLCLPLRMRDRIDGVLEAYGPESLAENDAVEILRSLATQAASALENARLYGELAKREKRLADLVGQLFAAQEEERRHVAYEVHDGLAQLAAGAHQHLQGFAHLYPPESEQARELLARALTLVQRTVGEARRVIAHLRPTALDDFGLQTAIRLEIDELRADGWNTNYKAGLGDEERLPVAVETALFRIAQEALTNVRRHADTNRIRLTLNRSGNKVRLTVRDWGQGFDPAAYPSSSGPGERVGLSSMRERVALLGGNLRVQSRSGVGTLIAVEVPLPEGYPEGDSF